MPVTTKSLFAVAEQRSFSNVQSSLHCGDEVDQSGSQVPIHQRAREIALRGKGKKDQRVLVAAKKLRSSRKRSKISAW